MNSRERILAALGNGQPDRVPVLETLINESIIVKLAEILMPGAANVVAGKDKFGEERLEILDLYCSIVKELGLDATSNFFSMGLENLDDLHAKDKFGTIYLLSEHGEPLPVHGPIQGFEDIRELDLIGKIKADDFANVKHVVNRMGKDKAHFLMMTDPFKISWLLRGSLEKLLVDYILNPQLVHALARITTDFNKAVIDMAVKTGIDGIFLVGDLAGERNTLMSPRHYREYIKPYQREMVDHAHKNGLKIVKHSDGNMWPILDDLMEEGFDAFHPIQPQCMDIAEVKNHLRGEMCLIGNIDCRHLLPFGTAEEVNRVVRETIAKAAPGGGYIVSSSNSIHPMCKPENYIAMVKAAHQYGAYIHSE